MTSKSIVTNNLNDVLESNALFLYEKKSDIKSSLEGYRRLWNTIISYKKEFQSLNDEIQPFGEEISLDHNLLILQYLLKLPFTVVDEILIHESCNDKVKNTDHYNQKKNQEIHRENHVYLLQQLIYLFRKQLKSMGMSINEVEVKLELSDCALEFRRHQFLKLLLPSYELQIHDDLASKILVYQTNINCNSDAVMIVRFGAISHNICLILLALGKPLEAQKILLSFLKKFSTLRFFPVGATNGNQQNEQHQNRQSRKENHKNNDCKKQHHQSDSSISTNRNLNIDSVIGNIENQDDVFCRIMFLVLDCVLTHHKGDRKGIPSTIHLNHSIENSNKKNIEEEKTCAFGEYVPLDSVINWIECHLEQISIDSQLNISPAKEEYANEIRFRLHLYKARILFLQHGRAQDVKVRQSKKEMKSAMEIYQHKLRFHSLGSNTTVESTNCSVGSASEHLNTNQQGDQSTTSGAAAATITNTEDVVSTGIPTSQRQSNVSHKSPRLDMQNQCALNLKANLECLKLNYKKSLVLCNEARLAGQRHRQQNNTTNMNYESTHESDTTGKTNFEDKNEIKYRREQKRQQEADLLEDLDSSMHYSNLGNVLQSTGRLHLALHYYEKALALLDSIKRKETNKGSNTSFRGFLWDSLDGVVRPVPTCDILHNSGICALRLKNWRFAYECMGKCVTWSPRVFAKRPRCWLRIAESCIGIHEMRKSSNLTEYDIIFKKKIKGITPRLLVKSRNLYENTCGTGIEKALSAEIGTSVEDVEAVWKNPLPRALSCLRVAFTLLSNTKSNGRDHDCLESIMLSLSYVMLELGDFNGALKLAKDVYEHNTESYMFSSQNDNSDKRPSKTPMSLERQAIAKVYACEAYCKLGMPNEALHALYGTPYPHIKDILKNSDHLHQINLENIPNLQNLALHLCQSHENSTIVCDGKTEKWELAQARSILHLSLSGVMWSLKDIDSGEKHAAEAMKILSSIKLSNEEVRVLKDAVKRFLLYYSIQKGNTDVAISLLRSFQN